MRVGSESGSGEAGCASTPDDLTNSSQRCFSHGIEGVAKQKLEQRATCRADKRND